MGRGFKVFVTGITLIAVIVGFSYIYTMQRVDSMTVKKYLDISQEMRSELELLIQEKSEAVLLVGLTLSHDKTVNTLLRSKKYNKLQLDNLSRLLQKYTSLKNVWFQIIDKHGTSVYRSWTSKHGDNLTDFRLDVAKMIRLPKVMSTISVGKFDMTFKSMVPVYDKYDRFIGIIETLAKFDSLVSKLKIKGYETLIIVDKHYRDQLTESISNVFVDDYYIANPQDNDTLVKAFQNHLIDLNSDTYQIDKQDGYLYTVLKIDGIDNRPMAYFVISKPLSEIDMSAIYETRDNIIKTLVLISIFLLVLIYIIYSVNYKKFIQQQNELLEETVEEKTEELQKQSKKMQYLAHHDSLTALPNKNLFLDRLKQAIKHAKRQHNSLGVLFLDLDRFKEINDTYGHDVGDELLRRISQRLQEIVRDDDTVARIGGDEFTVILPNTDQVNVVKVVEKIFEDMKRPFILSGVDIHATFSVGISIYKQDGETPDILLRNADTAMYKAKDSGKNTYQFYNQQMTELVRKRLQLDTDIRNGLKNGEFEAYYQPKIDATTLRVAGLEALIRWNHPTKGLLYPVEFIPFAEEIGLITEIDQYMLTHCVNQLVEWEAAGYHTGKLSINVSTKKLESDNFRSELYRLIEKSRVNTDLLELEILESQIMRDPEHSIDILRSVRSLGISISIDDFGTGYSSLSYLKKLPVSKLKIDRSFIIDVPEDEDDVAIVRTIISLAKNLKLEIIAEGVETEGQVEFLVQEGCRNIQGYYYSKALTKTECEAFMKKHG
ncbi:bifunctional diguanylate cyclase/phosphodiesterase [Sulfurimonas paralvinellae]|uniref:EAL domain-containing protein n=1 Tax=Sulfurimonas paralvinellae TaxID=317658 RepID=A0A7M1B9J5_9BACT|nr:EAL domain-containing protein [Sulfurimonas paralvinellae]QOP45488.1 EAL domain-containing protein [Sulfurimonas paralvinellae]